MLYAILCYNSEKMCQSWTKEEDDAVMANLGTVQERLYAEGKLGPAIRLSFTSSARTLRKDRDPYIITDGPYAETKEALLGFYIVDGSSIDEVMETARNLANVNPGGAYEVRPVSIYLPGLAMSAQPAADSLTSPIA